MRFRNLIAILGMGLILTACADLFTVHNVTEIPNIGDKTKINARAIHLDAQQRLVLVTARGYCAEPSPDALASYAASLGFDLNIFNQSSGSLANALQSDAASIGLRTQSITLMRDALYRMCEASNNGHLNETEVAAFLRRSQDLIAVVLAIEQLTGAVAANQVLLTPSAKAGASANLVSNHQLLDHMEKDVKEKKKAVEDAQSKLDTAKSEKDKAEITKNQKTSLFAKCTETNDKKPCGEKGTEKQQAERKFSEAEKQFKTADEALKAAQERLEKAREVRDTIKTLRDAALTSATAETAGTGKFSTVVQLNQLSDKATESVAKAVKEMVGEVLKKSYTPDVCLSHLISSEKDIQKKENQVNEVNKKLEELKKQKGLKGQKKENAKSAIGLIQTMQLQIRNNNKQQIQDIEQIKDLEIRALTIQARQAIQATKEINELNAICKNILKKDSK